MELTHLLLDAIWRPSFVMKFRSLKSSTTTENYDQTSWEESAVNPKNLVDCLDSINSRWRIDGATICGTQFFSVPASLIPGLAPLFVDLIIPDQDYMSPMLRNALDSGLSVVLRHPKPIANLGISKHLCRALDSYCERNPNFIDRYQKLPFGSKLAFEEVNANVAAMDVTVMPNYDLERQILSLDTLKDLWKDAMQSNSWPDDIDINEIELVRQLHDTVSIVRMIGDDALRGAELVFKSNPADLAHLYHELKFLLTSPVHPNIMPAPLHLITKRCQFGGKRGVVGFTIPYYPLGSIRDILPLRARDGSLSVSQQRKWCCQVASALLHIQDSVGTFYSDLRPDNVLLFSSNEGEACPRDGEFLPPPVEAAQDVLLCDFEQRGNWYEWSSPEVLYHQYVENLRTNLAPGAPEIVQHLIRVYSSPQAPASEPERSRDRRVDEAIRTRNPIWFSLSPSEQEKAHVYSLGLFIYCVFEGLSNVRVNLANAFPTEPEVQFPQFRRTPEPIQMIIKRCTIDAPEWNNDTTKNLSSNPPRVIRKGSKLYPENFDTKCLKSTDLDMRTAVLDTAMNWWMAELQKAKVFLDSEEWRTRTFGRDRPRLKEVLEMLQNVKL